MAAKFVRLEVDGGIRKFCCPFTGKTVFDEEEGFDENGEHSPYLRLFVDWLGTAFCPDADLLPTSSSTWQDELTNAVIESDDFSTTLNQISVRAPEGFVCFELVEPGRGGGHEESVCYVAFHFDPNCHELENIALQELD